MKQFRYRFSAKFDHKRHPTSIDLNAVRLCFQAFIEGKEKGKVSVPLPPVVSDPIYDKSSHIKNLWIYALACTIMII